MRVVKSPTGNLSISPTDIQTGVANALQQVNPTNVVATRKQDCAVTAIPAKISTPVEIAIDDSTPGAALASAVKSLEVTCTFGEPIEILSGATAGGAVRRVVANLGEGPMTLVCTIASGQHIYVRTMSSNTVTSGVLTVNLMG